MKYVISKAKEVIDRRKACAYRKVLTPIWIDKGQILYLKYLLIVPDSFMTSKLIFSRLNRNFKFQFLL